MSTMQELVEQVRGQIRDNKDPVIFSREVPTTETDPRKADDLEEFVHRAVQDYSRWRPLKGKPATLNVEAGRLNYELPVDFIEIEELPGRDYRTFQSTLFLIVPSEVSEAVSFFYTAMHGAETIPAYDVPAVVMFAAAQALRAVVSDPHKLEQFISYELNDVLRINAENTTEIGKELLKTASDWEKQYLLRVQPGQTTPAPKPYISFG